MTIQEAIDRYLKQIKRSKSIHTTKSYTRGLRAFALCLAESDPPIDFEQAEIGLLTPQWIELFLHYLQHLSVATEQLYTTAVANFYRYVAAQEWAEINLATLDFELSQRRKSGQRLYNFPEKNLEKVLEYMGEIVDYSTETVRGKLILQRDVALLFTLADTGLRVSEACELRYGDIDWEQQRAFVIGKGNKQAIVRFSQRSLNYIKLYLNTRRKQDKKQGRRDRLAIFARHGKKVGKRILPISPRTAENIVTRYVTEVLGEEARGTITPHTFRHYFVTRAVRFHDISIAQKLARHENISTTTLYTHLAVKEIDEAYTAVFDKQDQNK